MKRITKNESDPINIITKLANQFSYELSKVAREKKIDFLVLTNGIATSFFMHSFRFEPVLTKKIIMESLEKAEEMYKETKNDK